MKVIKVCTTIAVTAIICVILLFISSFRNTFDNKEQALIVKTQDGVQVNLEKIFYTGESIKVPIPLKYLDLKAEDIENYKTDCSCAIPELDGNSSEINIELDLSGQSGKISKNVIVIPKDKAVFPKVIRIFGEVYPSWYWQPNLIKVNDVKPTEIRDFDCLLSIQHKIEKISINEYKLFPPLEYVTLKANVFKDDKILIEGKVRGPGYKSHYNGVIKLNFNSECSHQINIPIEINTKATIQATPEIVTINADEKEKYTVSFFHYLGWDIKIQKVVFPHCVVGKYTKSEVIFESIENISSSESLPKSSNIDVFFENQDEPVTISVLIL
ncbi:MAG: hypothetical protein JXA96_09765 [Sedimentisphaerales bacterium]|nr:hypothetical protein [Sedimentisphaerales bacterium]